MNSLIRMAAAWIAQHLQRGDLRASLIGALLGVVAGCSAAYAIYSADAVPREFRYAIFVLLGVVGALLGAGAGSRYRPRADELLPGPVRLNNLNRALVPYVATAVFATLTALLILLPDDSAREDFPSWAYAAVGALLAAGSGVIAARSILWIDLDDAVHVRRLVGSRRYPFTDVPQWGFEVRRGELIRSPVEGVVPFVLSMNDGLRFELPALSPRRAHKVVERLSNARMRPG